MSSPLGSSKKRKTSVKALANAHEKELADKLGGIRQPASGAIPGFKGDIKVDNFLLDSKQTTNNSIVVSTRDLTKISEEAQQEGRLPGLVLTLSTPIHISREWAAIPLEVFQELLKCCEMKGNSNE